MLESIILGGGCFWCTEAIFQRVPGITKVVSGYAGGISKNPSYQEVCRGESGHVEVINITFDNEKISLIEILEIFFELIDPTTLNQQGADIGTQYRSAIFVKNTQQRKISQDYITSIAGNYSNPIVTEVEDLGEFYIAEKYHQNYFNENQKNNYCKLVISPKLQKLNSKLSSKN
jgi:methionine-S-sulfoxide reductase